MSPANPSLSISRIQPFFNPVPPRELSFTQTQSTASLNPTGMQGKGCLALWMETNAQPNRRQIISLFSFPPGFSQCHILFLCRTAQAALIVTNTFGPSTNRRLGRRALLEEALHPCGRFIPSEASDGSSPRAQQKIMSSFVVCLFFPLGRAAGNQETSLDSSWMIKWLI